MEHLNLVIDIGNTFAKAGLFSGDRQLHYFDQLSDRNILKLVRQEKPHEVLISSVRKGTQRLLKQISVYAHVSRLTHKTSLPFRNLYETPQTLGTDRIAGVAGAFFLFPNQPCLIIDAGTCITYDFLDAEGNYQGGSISPGLEMRFKALHKFTSKLPKIAFNKNYDLTGKTTKKAILSGVIEGTVAEINGIIQKYEQFSANLRIIINGGDTIFFETKIKGHIFAVQNLVMVGLNQIIKFNA